MVSFRGCLVLGGWDSSIFLNNLAQAIDLFCITGNLKAIVQQCATRSCHHHQIPLLLLCSLKPKTHSTWNSEHYSPLLWILPYFAIDRDFSGEVLGFLWIIMDFLYPKPGKSLWGLFHSDTQPVRFMKSKAMSVGFLKHRAFLIFPVRSSHVGLTQVSRVMWVKQCPIFTTRITRNGKHTT